MIPDVITDHVARGKDRLIELFKGGKPVLDGLMSSHIDQLQLLEDAIWVVLLQRLLPNAQGVQVDAVGRIVGAFRDGQTDDEYKASIAIQIRVNRSFGTTTDIFEILALCTDLPFTYQDENYDTFHVYIDLVPAPIIRAILRAMGIAKAAGYRALVEYVTDAVLRTDIQKFGWSGGATGQGGFGSSYDVTAGKALSSIQECHV